MSSSRSAVKKSSRLVAASASSFPSRSLNLAGIRSRRLLSIVSTEIISLMYGWLPCLGHIHWVARPSSVIAQVIWFCHLRSPASLLRSSSYTIVVASFRPMPLSFFRSFATTFFSFLSYALQSLGHIAENLFLSSAAMTRNLASPSLQLR